MSQNTAELVKVEFYNQQIEAICHDNKVWVSVNRLSENLGIAAQSQIKKIKENPAYNNLTNDIIVQHPSGAKTAFCLDMEALTLWLGSISASKVKESVRDMLIKYQRECMTVLTRHFFGQPQPQPQPAVPSVAKQLLMTAQVIVEHDERITVLEQRLEAQDKRTKAAARALLALPAPEDLPQPRTQRSLLVERMRQISVVTEVPHQELWNKLYREYQYRAGFDLKARAKNQDKKPLDVATELGVIGKLYDLCCFLWPQTLDDLNSNTSNTLN